MPLAFVTCGPSFEPLDGVRRITNHSTGEMGTVLAEALAGRGFEVICLRGESATFRPPAGARVIEFSTNRTLAEALGSLPRAPAVIFHAAALCDYEVVKVTGASPRRKIRSDARSLRIFLRPAPKLLPRLRALFPRALLVGWKYELDGSRAEAISLARRQMATAGTDASVINGSAYGKGLGFVEPGKARVRHFPSKKALAAFLSFWAGEPLASSRQKAAKAVRRPPSPRQQSGRHTRRP